MAQKEFILDRSGFPLIQGCSRGCWKALEAHAARAHEDIEGGDGTAHRRSYPMNVEGYPDSNPDMEQFIRADTPHLEFH